MGSLSAAALQKSPRLKEGGEVSRGLLGTPLLFPDSSEQDACRFGDIACFWKKAPALRRRGVIKAGALKIAYLRYAILPSSVKNETSWNYIVGATTCIKCNAFSEFNVFSVVLARTPPLPG